MAINIDGVVLRNVPEQVSKNVEDIKDLQVHEENHEIRITALEQGAIALATFQDCTFTGTTTIDGDIVQTAGDCSLYGNVSIGGSLTVAGSGSFAGISSSGNASIGGTIAASGAATFSSGATITGNCSVSGNLPVGGNITGNSIIENMSGYSASVAVQADMSYEKVYAGVVKNGNKLTLVACMKIERTGDGTNWNSLLGFTIPASVGAKLIPTTVGLTPVLDVRENSVFSSVNNSVAIKTYTQKGSNTSIGMYFHITSPASLTLNAVYFLRYEVTFLLSDSL